MPPGDGVLVARRRARQDTAVKQKENRRKIKKEDEKTRSWRARQDTGEKNSEKSAS